MSTTTKFITIIILCWGRVLITYGTETLFSLSFSLKGFIYGSHLLHAPNIYKWLISRTTDGYSVKSLWKHIYSFFVAFKHNEKKAFFRKIIYGVSVLKKCPRRFFLKKTVYLGIFDWIWAHFYKANFSFPFQIHNNFFSFFGWKVWIWWIWEVPPIPHRIQWFYPISTDFYPS